MYILLSALLLTAFGVYAIARLLEHAQMVDRAAERIRQECEEEPLTYYPFKNIEKIRPKSKYVRSRRTHKYKRRRSHDTKNGQPGSNT